MTMILPRLNGALTRQSHCILRRSPVFLPLGQSRYLASSITQESHRPSKPLTSKFEPIIYDYTHHSARFISTLDPSRLTPSDYQSLSRNSHVALYLRNPSNPLVNLDSKVDIDASVSQRWDTPHTQPDVSFVQYAWDRHNNLINFPDDANGFFYYFTPSKASPIAGQLRFRITPSADPSSWSSGRDLCWPRMNIEWMVPLLKIVQDRPMHSALRTLLLADKLISPELVERCMELRKWRGTLGTQIVLDGLEQPFYTSFSAHDRGRFAVIGREREKFVHMRAFFRDLRKYRPVDPYTGSAYCRFELFNSQRSRLSPHRLVLRVLKIIHPVSCCIPGYDGYLTKPKEGKLMTFGLLRKQPWHYDLDTEAVSPRHRFTTLLSLKQLPQNLVGLRLLLDYHTDDP